MSQVTTLITGAGVNTLISGQQQCEQYLLIGDVDTANPLQVLNVEIGGTTWINLQSAALITAFAKWQQEMTAATVGLLIKLATGKINRKTTVRMQNAGATTPNVYWFSEADGGAPLMASTVNINATSYADFDKFSALLIETPANIDEVQMVFSDGSKSTMTIVECDAWFNFYNQSEANGRLGTVSVIDNTQRKLQAVRISTNGVGACNVAVVKLPDEAFKLLTQGVR